MANISRHSDRLRRHYNEDRVAYLQHKEQQDREAAKVEFDHNYFLEQGWLTKELIITEAE